ncbi:VWFA domain-containing protein [Meloidogyne graminicola]|uniref:VWFA domain-containing protein n=1 Tax=Meloidogyne graminicola TaxID=189291 RepID=A0A8S9ZBL3_9BILA|nr:VWFA domain-containing protein [Meloidogyne graminicola]
MLLFIFSNNILEQKQEKQNISINDEEQLLLFNNAKSFKIPLNTDELDVFDPLESQNSSNKQITRLSNFSSFSTTLYSIKPNLSLTTKKPTTSLFTTTIKTLKYPITTTTTTTIKIIIINYQKHFLLNKFTKIINQPIITTTTTTKTTFKHINNITNNLFQNNKINKTTTQLNNYIQQPFTTFFNYETTTINNNNKNFLQQQQQQQNKTFGIKQKVVCPPLDILFIVDSSGSVHRGGGHRVSLLQFASSDLQKIEWEWDYFKNNWQMMEIFNKQVRHITGTTYIGQALKQSLKLLQERKRQVPIIVILLSDGFSQDDPIQQAKEIRKFPNIQFYALSIGQLSNNELLHNIVDNPSHVFIGNEASELLKSQLLKRIRKK